MATKPKKPSSTGGSLLELVLIVAVALGLALAIQAFLVKPYRIPSESMVPTLQIGQRVLVNRIGARFSDPSVGDIVVFHPPAGAERSNECGGGPPPAGQVCATPTDKRADVNFIKRVVAGPGDRISVRGGHQRTGEAPAPRLVGAGDEPVSERAVELEQPGTRRALALARGARFAWAASRWRRLRR